ncbi:hypothetical protein SAY87_025276 [Trapa incisa]|uniref:FLZ-type domain-containing protein n=2 Tax=Trapa TaxID=22665 RepID=A0AAN7LNY8_TRANT|nr:hypothetical protein SAY87_025276 [Trapa incisa]KAK4788114.1 hypothetical protein SAY86_019433 [Trapa natans]
MGSLASTGVYTGYGDHIHEHYFLRSCFRCSKPLGLNSDIFMYRGDTPFCSKECRQEQIEMDEANERRKRVNSSSNRSQKMAESSTSSSPSSHTVKSDTVVVA